ncbi:vacuolar protein sorting protein-like protein [Calycina marina]|uniref:Vacuolar protein-sorting-associated protein 36 n=1 Tax=Calycina marina TaxID=1763456 RepID=A0A9P7Z6E6_9HELO|nr:vacuolar protein sorting protein-like protein [Calycina marina]
MFLQHLDLTTALRPLYLEDEVLLFVQDNVGLYEGKYKIPDHQNGQIYLTSHRICYVDNDQARKNSVAIDLKDIEGYEISARFLKSSPKITLVPKPSKRCSLHTRVSNFGTPSRSNPASPLGRGESPFNLPKSDPAPKSLGTWICPICSFSNPVPSNFDPTTASSHTPLAPCLACGVKPLLAHVLKAAITNATNRSPIQSSSPSRTSFVTRSQTGTPQPSSEIWEDTSSLKDNAQFTHGKNSGASAQCPRCTFLNDPSLMTCEICGAPLLSESIIPTVNTLSTNDSPRSRSPGPVIGQASLPGALASESFKLSFRGGGEKIFFERLKGSMTQRKWLLQGAPPVPKPNRQKDGSGSSTPTGERKNFGIAGLEQRRMEVRKNNEAVIGNAFEDLEALMASAKEIIALAESFPQNNGTGSESNAVANALGLVTTKDMLGGTNSESLYISELSRNLAEFLTDDARGVLRNSGGIVSLVDLWAMFNRARGGVELVSPFDFEKAARQWEILKLPLRLRQFKSGVLVVQGSDRTDDKTIKALLVWLNDLHSFPPDKEVAWDWQQFGRGVTAQDVAERFGWSIGVAEEELEMAEEKGALCREGSIEGVKFWENWIDDVQSPAAKSRFTLQ